jgi:hypothetical protein
MAEVWDQCNLVQTLWRKNCCAVSLLSALVLLVKTWDYQWSVTMALC